MRKPSEASLAAADAERRFIECFSGRRQQREVGPKLHAEECCGDFRRGRGKTLPELAALAGAPALERREAGGWD